MPGSVLHKILENAVGGYPKYEGRFPCISGLKFTFDPSKPVGQRILMNTLKFNDGKSLDMNEIYTVGTTFFLSLGKDGFDAFNDPAVEDLTGDMDEAISV